MQYLMVEWQHRGTCLLATGHTGSRGSQRDMRMVWSWLAARLRPAATTSIHGSAQVVHMCKAPASCPCHRHGSRCCGLLCAKKAECRVPADAPGRPEQHGAQPAAQPRDPAVHPQLLRLCPGVPLRVPTRDEDPESFHPEQANTQPSIRTLAHNCCVVGKLGSTRHRESETLPLLGRDSQTHGSEQDLQKLYCAVIGMLCLASNRSLRCRSACVS